MNLTILTSLIGDLWGKNVYRSIEDLADPHQLPTLLAPPDLVQSGVYFKSFSTSLAGLFHSLNVNKNLSITVDLGCSLPGLVLQDSWCGLASEINVVIDASNLASFGLLPALFTYTNTELRLIVIGKKNARAVALKGTRDNPGKNVKAKSGLNRSILEQSWGILRQRLTDKATNATVLVQVILINPKYTGLRCSECGYTNKKNRKSQATFHCQSCGHSANADASAAKNIVSSAA